MAETRSAEMQSQMPCFLREATTALWSRMSRPRSFSMHSTVRLPLRCVTRTRVLEVLAAAPTPPEMCHALRIISSNSWSVSKLAERPE